VIKSKHAELLNALSEMQESPAYAARKQVLGLAEATILTQEQEIAAQQARIDELMFEYCPDEMTPEQIAEYERHQVAVDEDASSNV
jgi:hypothetical protein